MTAQAPAASTSAVPAPFEIFVAAFPGLEPTLCAEMRALGFRNPKILTGGVSFKGGWPDVWRANLTIRGASRVLARIGSFRAFHLAQLDKRARRLPWAETLRPDVPVRVEASCKGSRIYHAGAAAQRIERAIAEELGAPIAADAEVTIKARIDDDLCVVSVDTSGALLHKRNHKEAVNRAPMRETLAALFLRQCGFTGTEPVLDPMCGSGTFVIEAAEIAAGLPPGRSRDFAFQLLAGFDPAGWAAMRAAVPAPTPPAVRFYGGDRDAGAVEMSRANAERAGVAAWTDFQRRAVGEQTAPEGPPGLVIVNPPYGGRIGDKKSLFPLYNALGKTLLSGFAGWRVGVVANEPSLAQATGLPFAPSPVSVSHGGIRVALYQATIG